MGLLLVDDEPGQPADRAAAGRCSPTWPARPGPAVHGVRLTASLRSAVEQLQAARERLVLAGEEERRRMRRNLHDELAPTLAAAGLTASAAARPARPRPRGGEPGAGPAAGRTSPRGVGDIRRLVDELRPVLLDERGLVGRGPRARRGAARDRCDVTVEAPAPLPELPAAVEVAAYRICQEALMNVLKHSARDAPAGPAGACATGRWSSRSTTTGSVPSAPAARRGVGLASMRERAAELGGSAPSRAVRAAARGSSVRLPLRPAGA